jgi:hypothetical protein
MLSFNLDSYFFYSILPEIFIILFVLSLILIAVTGKKEDKWDLLPFFLEASVYFYVFLIMLLGRISIMLFTLTTVQLC